MKNLYKIDDELYIISNTENVNENCWIITDGKLVQVSYLLSDEVAKGNKIILTTNKLLINDGVQAIDDIFLEWFVKNPSCEFVEVYQFGFEDSIIKHPKKWYIKIPKEEPKQEILEEVAENNYYFESDIEMVNFISEMASTGKIPNRWSAFVAKINELYLFKKEQDKKLYSEEEVIKLLQQYRYDLSSGKTSNIGDTTGLWFEQFKKK
jgi:hypothetical protein